MSVLTAMRPEGFGGSGSGADEDDDPDGEIVPDYVWVRSRAELDALIAEVLSLRRWYPIVGLTTRPRERHPALSPAKVRAIVGADAPLYVISTAMTRPLRRELPNGLHVHSGAARIWWPIPRPGRDPHSHPLIYDPASVYGQATLDELAKAYETTRLPTRRSERLLEHRCSEAEERARRAGEQLRTVALESNQLRADLQALEARVRPAVDRREDRCKPPQSPKPDIDLEPRLHITIRDQWLGATSPEDRRDHPLGAYVLSTQLLEDLATRRVGLPIERIAWVLAMVASGRARELGGLSPHALTTATGGSQIVREDGAKGWRCTLSHLSGGPRLHYWTRPSGAIEFETIGKHSDLNRP